MTLEGIDISFNDLIPMMQEERSSEVRNQVQGMSAEELLVILSDKTVNDLVLKKMPKAKKKAPPTSQTVKESAAPKKQESGSRLRSKSTKDFFRDLTNAYAGD